MPIFELPPLDTLAPAKDRPQKTIQGIGVAEMLAMEAEFPEY